MAIFKKPILTKAPKIPSVPKVSKLPSIKPSTGLGIAGGIGLTAIPVLSAVLPSLTSLGSTAILASSIPDSISAAADIFDSNPILSLGVAGAIMLAAYKLF